MSHALNILGKSGGCYTELRNEHVLDQYDVETILNKMARKHNVDAVFALNIFGGGVQKMSGEDASFSIVYLNIGFA